jgi:hypothetical protein
MRPFMERVATSWNAYRIQTVVSLDPALLAPQEYSLVAVIAVTRLN